MRRALLWLLIAACIWEGWVFLYPSLRFWTRLAQATERVYDARPHTGDTVTDIEEFLHHQRRGA